MKLNCVFRRKFGVLLIVCVFLCGAHYGRAQMCGSTVEPQTIESSETVNKVGNIYSGTWYLKRVHITTNYFHATTSTTHDEFTIYTKETSIYDHWKATRRVFCSVWAVDPVISYEGSCSGDIHHPERPEFWSGSASIPNEHSSVWDSPENEYKIWTAIYEAANGVTYSEYFSTNVTTAELEGGITAWKGWADGSELGMFDKQKLIKGEYVYSQPYSDKMLRDFLITNLPPFSTNWGTKGKALLGETLNHYSLSGAKLKYRFLVRGEPGDPNQRYSATWEERTKYEDITKHKDPKKMTCYLKHNGDLKNPSYISPEYIIELPEEPCKIEVSDATITLETFKSAGR